MSNHRSSQESEANLRQTSTNRATATDAEVARRNAYAAGRSDENHFQQKTSRYEHARAQADTSAASNLFTGFLIALLAGGLGAALYFLTSDRSEPVAAPEPDLSITEVEIPDIDLPDVNVEVPEVNLPEAEIPEIGSPKTTPSTPDNASLEGASDAAASEAQ